MWRYPECAHIHVIRAPAVFYFTTTDIQPFDDLRLGAAVTMTPEENAEGQLRDAGLHPGLGEPSRAYARSLDILARAPRSVRDLRRRLLLKGEVEADVEIAVQRLTAAGLLDDAAYSRAFVRSKVSSQGFSRRRLQQELAKRGVARDVATIAIAEVLRDDDVDEVANIERAALKKLRTLRDVDGDTQRRRVYAYLARRGYEVDEVRLVVDRLRRAGEMP